MLKVTAQALHALQVPQGGAREGGRAAGGEVLQQPQA
jgi:hypothetical protein